MALPLLFAVRSRLLMAWGKKTHNASDVMGWPICVECRANEQWQWQLGCKLLSPHPVACTKLRTLNQLSTHRRVRWICKVRGHTEMAHLSQTFRACIVGLLNLRCTCMCSQASLTMYIEACVVWLGGWMHCIPCNAAATALLVIRQLP